jgi:glycine/D-amino acid oxidase-like deaminating enzyme
MSWMSVVVIGAGSVGANIAYRLARRGAAVTVVDAQLPGHGTSGVSFAWLNSFGKLPREYHDLNAAGIDEHARLAEELGDGSWLHRDGALTWREEPEERARLLETVERLTAWRYPIELLSRHEAQVLEPDLHIASAVNEVVFAPREGYVDMAPFIGALLRHAAQSGAHLVTGDAVVGLVREGSRVRGVRLASGARLDADWVVSCVGPATDAVAGLADVTLPMACQAGRLVYTTPVAATLRRPVHAPGGHFRPDGGGRIVLSEQHHDYHWRADGPPAPPERSIAALTPHLPALGGARVEATRVGVRPIPVDGLPAVGPIPGREGFYVVVSHSAVTLGPLWGQLVATEVLDGRTDPRLGPFRPVRFASAGPPGHAGGPGPASA